MNTRTARASYGGETGTGLTEIMDLPVNHAIRSPRIDLRPLIIVAFAVCYAVTVSVVSMTVVSINGASVALTCLETGGQWVIGDSGQRECVRRETR